MGIARLVNRRVLGCKTETTQSTENAPVAADYLYVQDLVITPSIAQEKRNFYRQTIGKLAWIPGESFFDVSFKTEIKGSGTPGVVFAPLDAIFRACAFIPTIHAGVEAIGAAVADPLNGGVSPAPIITIGTPAFSAKSGTLEITLISHTDTNPEGAVFDAIFYPGDGSTPIHGTFTVSDSAFTAVAGTSGLSSLALTTNDPDFGGVGNPVSTWRVGDVWRFVYTSASQVDVQYAPTSDPTTNNYFGAGKSMTIYAFFDGTKRIIAGVMGSLKASMEVNKIGMYEFKGSGIYAGPADAGFPTQTYNTLKPEILVSAAFSIQGYSGIISKAEFDIANKVSKRVDASAATGLQGFHITDRDPVGSFDPEATLVAEHDWIGKLKSGAEGAVTIKQGQTAGNITLVTSPKAQYASLKDGEREGKHTNDLGVTLNESVGNDELVFTLM